MNKSMYVVTGGVLVAAAALAWAASSTNYTLDPVVIDDGGEIASSSNYDLLGSINGAAFAADVTGGNQNGTASTTNFVTVVGFPESANPSAAPASGALVSLGAANPAASNELTTTTASIPMLQFTVSAGAGGAITINSITVTASGSGNDATRVSGVDVYTDVNANGVVDGGSDTTIASQQTFSGDNGTATFTPSTGIPISAGGSVTYLVVYTFAGTAIAGDTFTAAVVVGGMGITDASAQPVVPNGLPVTGGQKTMVASGAAGTLTLAIGPASPGGTPVAANTTNAPWLQFTAAASTVEAVTINTIRFTASGTLNDALHVAAVKLYLDAGTPGIFDVADTQLGTTGVYSGNDGTVNFTSLGQVVGAGGSATFLVIYNVSASATAGATGACTIAVVADVGTTGGTSGGPVTVAGTPVGAARSIQVALPSTVTTPGGGGGGGCALVAPGTVLPAGDPLGVLLPWLLGLLALLTLRRRAA